MMQFDFSKVIGPIDWGYFKTTWFLTTTSLLVAGLGLYAWIKYRRRPRYPAWQD